MRDDRTSKLNLPLPSGENTLNEDLPRLRQAFSTLDKATPLAATQAETNAGTAEDKYVSPKRLHATSIAAARISGVLDISNIPRSAIEDMVDVQNDAARFALQPGMTGVHLGSSVRVLEDDAGNPLEPPRLYVIKDMTHLGDESGYRQYSMVIQWEDVQGKPELALQAGLDAEAEAREAETAAREEQMATHDASAVVHDALVRRITVGDISPIIGVCQVATGNTTGLWYNVDMAGQPITPNRRYFDFHPIYDSMRRVLVDDQVMVRIEPFWFKYFRPDSGPFIGKPCRVIAPGQTDGFRPFPAFLNTAGNVVPLYIGAFSSTDEGGGKAGSRPGKYPLVSLDFPTMRGRCSNRNTGGVTGFRMWDVYHYSALVHLFLTEHCTPEAQGLYGRGWVDSSSAVTVDDDHQPNWRGFVGLWGNVWEMCDGFRLDAARKIEMFKNDGSQVYVPTGKVFPSYNGTAPEYAITVQEGSGDGWDMSDGYFPLTKSGDRTAGSFGDYFYGGNGSAGNVLYVGGGYGNGSGAGLFCLSLSNPASHSATDIGCRLAKT